MATLKDLGLSEYETRVYRALLRTGPTHAKTVSRASNVPMGRIYDVLDSLETTNLVRRQNASQPKKYAAVDPETGLHRLLDEKRRELDTELQQYENTIDSLIGQLESKEPTDQFWTVAMGPDDSIDLLIDRLGAATEQVIMVSGTPSPQFDLGEVGKRIADELEATVDREIDVSLLISPDLLRAVPQNIKNRYMRSLGDHPNFDVRTHKNLRGTFNVIDRTEVCIGVPNPLEPNEALALIDLTDPTFAANVYDEFKPRWDRAEPITDVPTEPPAHPTN